MNRCCLLMLARIFKVQLPILATDIRCERCGVKLGEEGRYLHDARVEYGHVTCRRHAPSGASEA